ncbi:MAG: hypothetical protein FWH04_00130 [Oscillospiraceae bacterium]|nr:hypothetical protein [Oscillospiraceae bacterium]
MSRLQALLAQDIKPEGEFRVVASERILGDGNKPAEWRVSGITKEQNARLYKKSLRCYSKEPGQARPMPGLDAEEYSLLLAVECTVYPDLEDRELQASYGASDPAELLRAMLLPGELEEYKRRIQEYYGFGPGYPEEIDETVKALFDSGDRDTHLAYHCLTTYHWTPSYLMSLSAEDRGVIDVIAGRAKKEAENMEKRNIKNQKYMMKEWRKLK